MGWHDPFGHLKHKLWPKEGSKVKLVCDILLKALNEGYNFASHLVSNGGLHRKLCAPKVVKIPGQNAT